MKFKVVRKMISVILTMAMVITIISVPIISEAFELSISYKESTKVLSNPERGFYTPCYIYGVKNGTEVKNPSGKVVHLRIGLGGFSHEYQKYQGNAPTDYTQSGWTPLTQDFINSINKTMDNIRNNGSTVVIRFAYDDFRGIANMEPKMEGILYHINQLKSFFEANEDVILAVESGFVGRYGEQHTSSIVSPSYSETTRQTIYTVVNGLLDVVPSSISVTVRRPTYAAYACGLTMAQLQETVFSPQDKYYRVGVFNDGMYGSSTDLGTFLNREEETAWLNRQALHTAYGGETNNNHSTDGKDYTDGNFVCEEMMKTHVTYLNGTWPKPTIDGWKNKIYNGNDLVYAGIDTYTFFENHMGYRYVLRSFSSDKEKVSFSVENVGAGNMLKPKKTSLVFVDEKGSSYEQKTNIDIRNWNSQSIAREDIPVSLQAGKYKVYLKIADKNGNQVEFANDNSFNENGNLIGYMTIDGETSGGEVTGPEEPEKPGEPEVPEIPDTPNPPQEPENPPVEEKEYDEDGYYRISNEEQLLNFVDKVKEKRTLSARLHKDIKLTRVWNVIYEYSGIFDGNGYSISGLAVDGDGQEYQGFIGTLKSGGLVKDLKITSGYVDGDACVGAIAGKVRDGASIENCTSYVTVSGRYRVAGITGYNEGNISDCKNYGAIGAEDTGAGIVAYHKLGTVSNCKNYASLICDYKGGGIAGDQRSTISNSNNYGNILGTARIGGISGYASLSSTTNCSNSGKIYATSERVGGITGYLSEASVVNSINSGEIECLQDAGGIVGYNYQSTITGCSNSGLIKGNSRTGGIVGYNKSSSYTNCINTGTISGVKYWGSICGRNA